jgi:hypothetical protein
MKFIFGFLLLFLLLLLLLLAMTFHSGMSLWLRPFSVLLRAFGFAEIAFSRRRRL